MAKREEPVNLDRAEQHPNFHLVPGIGEEAFSSFLGVPIIHQRRVLGVLVVQQQERRRFDESEEAFLVTLSAQLGAVVAHAEATGAMFVVSDTRLRLLRPARLDDLLDVTVGVQDAGRASMRLAQQAWRGAELLAEGDIRIGCVDQHSLRPRRFPEPLSDRSA